MDETLLSTLDSYAQELECSETYSLGKVAQKLYLKTFTIITQKNKEVIKCLEEHNLKNIILVKMN
jgi:hypothetical protein